MSTPIFSIIIPVYNGHDVIGRALDSIYSQGLSEDQFEVICVDDCSPTMDTWRLLNSYTCNGTHPSNLILKRHEENKRQGAARNTALKFASGEYILYLDADDCFVSGSLQKLSECLSNYSICDCVMFDFQEIDPFRCSMKHSIFANQNLPIGLVMSGGEFIQQYPIPWGPVFYAYKRSFLLVHNILFVENERFEDTDYVIKSTLYAKYMTFLPLEVMSVFLNYGSTTTVGSDIVKITDLFRLSQRIKIIAGAFIQQDRAAAMAAMNHHICNYHEILVRFLWRLPYHSIVNLLQKYRPYENSGDALINFATKHPHVYALTSIFVRPFLLGLSWVKSKVRQ